MLDVGTRLGAYEIRAPIGAGGMGEVYRAHDTKLGRDVALKVLPDTFARDPDRLTRFEREAHLLASLSHPNIAPIHGLEECSGLHYLVLELVRGETLAERLAAGPLALEEALRICGQIAEAFEAAHEQAIIHRDLKPGNVMVTPDGKVKVLDFGLAKAFASERKAPDSSESPTGGIGDTIEGTILGTAAYMSPEQARGKPVDRRTDIWSFGCVLYETLTRKRAFWGETMSDTIAVILGQEPDWSVLPRTTPRNITVLLHRCLQKDPHQRLHDIADARLEVEEALRDVLAPRPVGAPAEQLPKRSVWTAWRMSAAAVAFLVATAALFVWITRRPASLQATGLRLAQVARLTHDSGLAEWPTWSPDGTLLAFASNRSGNFDIYVRRVEGGQEVNVTGDVADDFQPAFSPDGKWIAFVSTRSSRTGTIKIGATFGFEFRTYGGDVWVAPALGGPARRLAQDGNFPAWHPDGKRIAYVGGPEFHRSILEISSEGGTPKALLSAQSSKWEIVRLRYSPDGVWLGFETVNPERIMLMPAAGGSPREVVNGLSHVWDVSASRFFYLTRDPAGGTRLLSAAFDLGTGTLRGSPQTVGVMTGILRDLAISHDGHRFAASELEGALNLTRLPLTPAGDAPGGPEETLSTGQVIDRYPVYSPDGRRIAFASDRLGREEIWILNLDTKRQERLELPGTDLGANLAFWTPDGQRLTITRFYPDGNRSLWLVAVDGSHAEELQPSAPGLSGSPISPDGRTVLYSAKVAEVLQLFALDLATRRVRQLTSSPGDKEQGAWSPDGRWLAFTSNAGGSVQVWRMKASGDQEERLTSGNDRVRHMFYSPDGRWLYFQPNHQNIYRMPASGGAVRKVTDFPTSGLFIEEPGVSPDGHYLAYCRSNGGSSLWVLTIEGNPTDTP